MLERLPVGRTVERRLLPSASEMQELLAALHGQTFHGVVRLRGPDWEAALVVQAQETPSALFEAGRILVQDPEATRQILRLLEEGNAEAEVMALPPPVVSILRRMTRGQLLHRDLSTEFIRLASLHHRLLQEGFQGVMVVRGTGWWAFLSLPASQALYYDREAASERDPAGLVSELALLPAEIDIWRASEEPEAPWTSFRGDEVFIPAPGLHLQEVVEALGPLAGRILELLDGTRDLHRLRQELAHPPDELERILLQLQRRKWIYRFIRRQRTRA
ncbi:MAG: hypothetical protein QN193_08500 [Armatimonadota bacterium]|nr:hypothetical protein [Armatimonadota bacterium]MDR7445152.1 hypothetical protein [Armatimonadota bacterium]MDR7570635.1 hypothetical protein [Armatimonadota bacterium]MDR7613991.1 hypothetical protein [Armatimonadota bacterium]